MKRFLRTLCILFPLLLLSFFCLSQSRYISATTKKIVYTRDGGVCKCCGSSLNLEYDHIKPYSCGGKSEVLNIQLLCRKCNRSKSNSCICKIHDKQIGIDCCGGKLTKRYHTIPAQCTGITKKGIRCKRKTTSSNGRCHLH